VKKLVAKKKVTKEKVTRMPSRKPEDILAELVKVKANIKMLEEREKELKADLGVYVEGEGIQTQTGSINLIIGDKLAQKQARKSVSLDSEKAEALFKELKIWKDVIQTKEVIDDNLVEQAFLNNKITQDQLESITKIKLSYALVIKDYKPEEDSEEMPLIK
jgi:ribosomal protein S9